MEQVFKGKVYIVPAGGFTQASAYETNRWVYEQTTTSPHAGTRVQNPTASSALTITEKVSKTWETSELVDVPLLTETTGKIEFSAPVGQFESLHDTCSGVSCDIRIIDTDTESFEEIIGVIPSVIRDSKIGDVQTGTIEFKFKQGANVSVPAQKYRRVAISINPIIP